MKDVFELAPPKPARTIQLKRKLTLSGALRYETARDKWRGKKVLIRSREHGAFWRDKGAGYTVYVEAAGRYDFDDALSHTRHCDPSKGIVFYLAP